MKKYIVYIVMMILVSFTVSAEFSSYTNFVLSTENSTASKLTVIQTLIVGSDYDDRFKVVNDEKVQAFAVYQIEDMGTATYSNLGYVNITCTFIDSIFNEDGDYTEQEISTIHSEIYTSANTPTAFITIGENQTFGLSDQIQCIHKHVYRTNENFTLTSPVYEEFITPSYKTNFIEFAIDSLELQQAYNSVNVIQTYNNRLVEWTHYIARGVFEVWLVIFWIIKIVLVYLGVLLLLAAILFPVEFLLRFREKIKKSLDKGKEVN